MSGRLCGPIHLQSLAIRSDVCTTAHSAQKAPAGRDPLPGINSRLSEFGARGRSPWPRYHSSVDSAVFVLVFLSEDGHAIRIRHAEVDRGSAGSQIAECVIGQ